MVVVSRDVSAIYKWTVAPYHDGVQVFIPYDSVGTIQNRVEAIVAQSTTPVLPEIPPLAGAEPVHPPAFAGFWVRTGARIIDVILYNILALVIIFLLVIVIGVVAAVSKIPAEPLITRLDRMTATSIIASLLASIVYHTLAEGLHGSTLGKLILGLTVLGEQGRPCGMRAALIRSAAFFVDGLFFALPAYFNMRDSLRSQRLGDEWAHTIVVRRRSLPPEQRRSGVRFLGALIAACVAYSAIFALGQLLKL